MGVRIEVEEGERIGQVLRRLNLLVNRAGVRYCLREWKWRQTEPGEFRRWHAGKAKVAAQRAGYRKRLKLGIQ
jgi:hypothetical protein